MAADGFTTVHVTTDPVEGEMLAEALRGEAIDARVEHVNSALLGAGPQLFEIRVMVADESAAQARAILDDLRHPALVEELSSAPAADSEDAPAPAARDPRKAGIGFLLPGAGHFYAGRPWTGLTLEVGILSAIVVLRFRADEAFVSNLSFATVFAIVVADVLGAWRALRAVPSSAPEAAGSQARQVARGVGLLGLAIGGAAVAATLAALPAWLRGGHLADLAVSCTDRDVTISNTGRHAWYVSVDWAGVATAVPTSAWADRVVVDDTSVVRIGAGERIVRGLTPLGIDLERCRPHDGRAAEECALLLRMTTQEIDSSANEPHALEGRCLPDWSGGHHVSPATVGLRE
jgi:hypothetical protein